MLHFAWMEAELTTCRKPCQLSEALGVEVGLSIRTPVGLGLSVRNPVQD